MERLPEYIREMRSNRDLINGLYMGLTNDMIHWRSAPGKWSLLEIICHLYDEEREDFRARLQSVLEDPQRRFVSIDPAGWVISRNYAGQDLGDILAKFSEERNKSIAWLQTLEQAAWGNTAIHPKIGPMSARFMLANWLAHDYLHIRQIIKTKYDYYKQVSGENLSYAGDW